MLVERISRVLDRIVAVVELRVPDLVDAALAPRALDLVVAALSPRALALVVAALAPRALDVRLEGEDEGEPWDLRKPEEPDLRL
jgi:hypothetical protein